MNYVYIILYLIIGFASLFYGLKTLRIYLNVKRWTKLKAAVINKAVLPKKLTKASRRGMRVSIEYTYVFNAQSYTNDKVFLAELMNGERGFTGVDGEKFLRTIPDEAVVYVNPTKPEESVMFADGLGLYVFMIVFGFMAFCTGLFKLLLVLTY
jgi:hypothetical protein